MIPPIASRFVAGETPAELLEHVRQLEDQGVRTICNRLGEHYEQPEPAIDDRDAYCDLLTDIDNAGLGACISVKPSQIGLGIGEETFRENLAIIVDRAATHEKFVWIDMEDHPTTDATLDAYADHATEYERVGVCIQANLKRTPEDLRRLADLPGKVRLVKGAYDEPAAIAHRKKPRVNEAYRDCLDFMFEEFDDGIAVGSHDPAMIEHATRRHEEFGTDFEIQMLMGVREEAQLELAEEYDVWQYAPYGGKWLSYFSRRAMERTENLTFALRAIVGQ
ncbi:proline dehydrogenase family protein [Halococcus saccharolyticus]|uniref:proline dehydrogenase n=1 Tax=Halococcus saccharolyticus DSM 5350 TaxID=1227455 RepID=M0M9M2_9EURY|nr:proline dehydrogenase family protein [Halococcus saccharolyticus]EMA42487.1 proline dehydrogenase [Halococcus saccharolyticus DSM 5350]